MGWAWQTAMQMHNTHVTHTHKLYTLAHINISLCSPWTAYLVSFQSLERDIELEMRPRDKGVAHIAPTLQLRPPSTPSSSLSAHLCSCLGHPFILLIKLCVPQSVNASLTWLITLFFSSFFFFCCRLSLCQAGSGRRGCTVTNCQGLQL